MVEMNLRFFGGRGASSGISDKGKPYGSEYTTLYKSGNIKFVRYNDGSATAPMETMTKGRVYAVVNAKNEIKSISLYDKNNKRYKQIDITGNEHIIDGKKTLPHTHFGYFHDENGTRNVTAEENALIDKVKQLWYAKNSKN